MYTGDRKKNLLNELLKKNLIHHNKVYNFSETEESRVGGGDPCPPGGQTEP